ncbi:autotransporter assembly complex protein TamA [Avibacterium avium]|uniref:autotransporter assembly complex protein TamA n=1 Tax=Avibacterium avium TaxID=751 RepID=UPI003BF86076
MKLLQQKKRHLLSALSLLAGCVLTSLNVYAEHTVDLKVIGVKGVKAIENVDIYTKMIDPEEADGSDRYQYIVSEAIKKALRVYGYYNIKIDFRLQPAKGGKRPVLIADVNAGKPVLLTGMDIQILGQAKDDEAFKALDKKLPKLGELLYHSKYEDYKSDLQSLALARGYFDADFDVSQLLVRPSTYQGWWKITFDSGERYRFGKFTFQRSQIREDYLRNMMEIEEGQPYLINDLSSFTNDYTSTNWFSSVLVQPNLDEENKIVNVDVLLTPRKKNAMDVGIGYSTDVGPRFQWGWTKPWINSRGHSFRFNLYASAPKQTVEAVYKMPLLKNPLRYYYEFSTGYEREKTNDTETSSGTFAALRYWNRVSGWQHALGLRVRYDSFTQANHSDRTWLVYPTASISRTRLRGGLFPTWGDAQRLTVDFGHKIWLSDANFFKVQASSAWIRTFADNHRFLVRGEIGWLQTKNLEKIPPALRFFAGGDRSVRGYGYKKISPKNAEGKLVGATRLATGTLEYQYQVYENWWLATFADTGLAANSFNLEELRYGAGMGVRWASPIGAVKLDIATPIRDKDNSKNVQFYIGLGSEL